jgi:hypothetical protein
MTLTELKRDLLYIENAARGTYTFRKIGIILGILNLAIETQMIDDFTKYCMVKKREYRKLVMDKKEE